MVRIGCLLQHRNTEVIDCNELLCRSQARNKTRVAEQLAQLAEKEEGSKTIMDRDNGACADKINAHDVVQTIQFLKERASSKEEELRVDVTRVRRHIKHAVLNRQQLAGFAARLIR